MHIMEIAFYVLIGVFGLTSFIHLIFCLLEKEAWRKATKPLTTLLLTGAILILTLTYPEMPFPKTFIVIMPCPFRQPKINSRKNSK